MLYLWWSMDEDDQRRVWRLYGRFCGLMLCGSCLGVVTWAARMISLVNGFSANDAGSRNDRVRQFSLVALSYSWTAVFLVTYAIEFLCLSAAKLMVLDRMSDFAAGQHDGMRKLLVAVMAVVVLGNAVGLAANVAAAVHAQRAAEAASSTSAFFAANNTKSVNSFRSLSQREIQLSISINSVQQFGEVTVLLLVVAAFVVVGVVCARAVSSRLRAVDAASPSAVAVKEMRRQMVVTTAVVFIAFVVRSVYAIMAAVARQLQDSATRCPGVTSPCDPSCNNVFAHIHLWMAYTPEFQVTVILISSPLALLVALWGMTSKQTLQLVKLRQPEMTSTSARLLS
jgi:hypothetical protein